MTAVDKEWLPPRELRRWFDDPKPLSVDCEKLTRDIRIAVNRHDNAQVVQHHHPKHVPPHLLKDVDPGEELNRRRRQVNDDAKRLLTSLCELEEYAGPGDHWGAGASLTDVQIVLGKIGVGAPTLPAASPAPGRPPEPSPLHKLWRQIARLIKAALKEAGYRGDLTLTHPNSAIAIVGAKVVSRIHEITPEGFADAMRDRDRSKGKKTRKTIIGMTDEESEKEFSKRFPGAQKVRELK
jgi:hypothetical protein